MPDNILETTGKLFAAISTNAQRWLQYWSDVTLHPKIFAKRFHLSTASSLKMFVINNAIGFLTFLLIFCVYWAIFFRKAFRTHWNEDIKSALFILSAPFFLAVLSLIFVVIPGLIAFSVFHFTGDKGTLSGHISRVLACTNLEWVTAVFFSMGFLANDFTAHNSDWGVIILVCSAACIFLIRLYYTYLQSLLLLTYHGVRYEMRYVPALATLVIMSVITGLFYSFIYFMFLAIAIKVFD
jgi:hypothetical protein